MFATQIAPAQEPSCATSAQAPRQARADHGPAWSLWRTTEVSTLRALYPSGGSRAVHEALPHRSLSIGFKLSDLFGR